MNADGSCERDLGTDLPALSEPAFQPTGALPPPRGCTDLHAYGSFISTVAGKGAPQSVAVIVDNDGTLPVDGAVLSATPSSGTIHPFDPACSTGAALRSALPRIPAQTSTRLTFELATDRMGRDTVKVAVGSAAPVTVASDVLACRHVGSYLDDTLYGTNGRDTICGLTGADRLYGRGGNDLLDGGSGDDVIYGGAGRDVIYGRAGRDVIFACDGERDVIDCGSERDTAVVDRFDVVRHCERVLRA
jgi:hypothetical protein